MADQAQAAYKVIYGALRKEAEAVGSGGMRIGSYRELSERFSVTPSTVIRAINLLKQDGWAYGRQGKGTYVRRPPEPQTISQILMITPALDADTARYTMALDESLDHDRYSLAVSSTHGDLRRYQKMISHAGSLEPAGIILLSMPPEICPIDPQPLVRAGVPVVVIGEAVDGLPCDRVVFSPEDSAEKAARYALSRRARNPAVLLAELPRSESDIFLKTIRRECSAAGVDLSDERVFRVRLPHGYARFPDPYIDAQKKMERLLSKGASFDTLICDHDYPAVGALRALLKAGVHVPEQAGIISALRCSVDGATPMMLTTVASHRERQARMAGRLLFRRLDGYDGPPEVHYVDGELIHGETLQ